MPEVSSDATLIIATSWQALKRAEHGDERAWICNCTVIIVFAAFFIEANLNRFIEKAAEEVDINPPPDEFAGLQKKLGWVYNSFIASTPEANSDQLAAKLEEEFPGFQTIRNFRNGVSHGVIDRSVATLSKARELRIAAKAIVDHLLAIAQDNGIKIERGVEYNMAINSFDADNIAA